MVTPETRPATRPAQGADDSLLTIRRLTVGYARGGATRAAVSDVSLEVAPGECLAIVGESGSGKTTVARAVAGLLPSFGVKVSGHIRFAGQEIVGASEKTLRTIRGPGIGMVFQNPMTSLNPRLSVGAQVYEALRIKPRLPRDRARARVTELFRSVGLPDDPQWARKFPNQLSGGMQQRVVIAIALSRDPRLLVVDEGTTALDVTIQAQVLNLLRGLREERGVALLMISHDLAVVAGLADRVAVMEQGVIVECGPVDAVFSRQGHPYTDSLIGAVNSDPRVPVAVRLGSAEPVTPTGCHYSARCVRYIELDRPARCRDDDPGLIQIGPQHRAACHFAHGGRR